MRKLGLLCVISPKWSRWSFKECRLSTCCSIELILSTSQSMRKRFSCRRSISSMIRLYSMGSTMFPTERAVTCQLLATADSMMAWRIAKPGRAEGEKSLITHPRLLDGERAENLNYCTEDLQSAPANSSVTTCSLSEQLPIRKIHQKKVRLIVTAFEST